MIVTVTPNVALDITYRVARFATGATNRVDWANAHAGGKGVNVARVLTQLGVPAMALGFKGGPVGSRIERELDTSGIAYRLVEIAGENRRCIAVFDESSDTVTDVNEPGPKISPGEWAELERALERTLASGVQCAVLSGSLPPGLAGDVLASLGRRCREARVPFVLDASGDALREGLAPGPAIAKPNRAELASVASGGPAALRDESEVLAAADDLRRAGAESVVVSLGPEGLLAATAEGAWKASVPPVRGNPVGAGDAVAAALARGLVEERPWPERLGDAVALAAAAVAAPVAGRFDEAVYSRARNDAIVETVVS